MTLLELLPRLWLHESYAWETRKSCLPTWIVKVDPSSSITPAPGHQLSGGEYSKIPKGESEQASRI